jgi:hypothetical protein
MNYLVDNTVKGLTAKHCASGIQRLRKNKAQALTGFEIKSKKD